MIYLVVFTIVIGGALAGGLLGLWLCRAAAPPRDIWTFVKEDLLFIRRVR